jgi:transposase-like protein
MPCEASGWRRQVRPGLRRRWRRWRGWPGNVRQLEAVVSALVVERQGAPIGLEHLPPGLLKQHALAEVGDGTLRLAATRRATIVAALARAGGNKAEAARLLGIGRSTLYRQLAALHLDPTASDADCHSPAAPTRVPARRDGKDQAPSHRAVASRQPPAAGQAARPGCVSRPDLAQPTPPGQPRHSCQRRHACPPGCCRPAILHGP